MQEINCIKCSWKWNLSQSEESDKYVCHKCGFDNTLFYDVNLINKFNSKYISPKIPKKK